MNLICIFDLISQKEISSVVGVTEVTLCSMYKEFLRKINFSFIQQIIGCFD